MNRLPQPPSSVTGPLRDYLNQIAQVLNALPTLSFFSGTTPNSNLTGGTAHLAFNLGSASTSSRLWVNTTGPLSGATTQGWVIVRVLVP